MEILVTNYIFSLLHTYRKGKCITFYEMITSYLIIIAKHRLSNTIFLYFMFLVTVSSIYLEDYMNWNKYISLIQITFSHTYTHIEKVNV